jgi:gamma-glutamylputrescine oxidase
MELSRRRLLIAGAGVLAAPGVAGLAMRRDGVEIDGRRDDSVWTSEAPPPPQPTRLEGDRRVDLAIIGSGYTGLACAYYARRLRPDWSVIVLESHGIGSGASSRNSGAVYARQHGISDGGVAQRGLDRLRRFIEKEEIECDFAPAPTLQLLTSKSAAKETRSDLPPGARWVSAEELRESTGSEYYAGAIDAPGYFTVHPAKLVVGHARAALGAGAELFERSPALAIESGRPAAISTPGGRVLADHVFIATNAHTPRLGFFARQIVPVHQYSLATRRLTSEEIRSFGLDRWALRFERRLLPVTVNLTSGGRFFVRIVTGYASFNSCEWGDMESARQLGRRIFEQRYPRIADFDLADGWHGVTGHTLRFREISGALADGNIHVSAAYNGLGVMPGHNNGYLTACRITGHPDVDTRILTSVSGQIPVPGEYYRSLIFKPFMSLMTPV